MNEKLELGLISLSEIKLRMKYDLGKTLTENLISEQPESAMDRRLGITSKNMTALGLNPSSVDDTKKYNDNMGPKTIDTSDWGGHDWLALVEISTGILGLIPTPLSPILLGISSIAGVADASMYYYEGDKYMGTLMLALSIIPGGELLAALKRAKTLTKTGVEGTKELIKKYKTGVRLTKVESDDLVKIGEEFVENSSIVNKLMNKSLIDKIIKSLSKQTPKYIINLILILKKLGIIKLSEIGLKIGGLVYGIDKLYLFVFRDLLPSQKDLDQRTRNELRATINGLLGNEDKVKEYLMMVAIDGLTKLMDRGDKPLKIDTIEPEEFFKEAIKRESELIKNTPKSLNSPSFNDVLSGKSIIKKGQSGESVKTLQKMLYEIGYDYLVSGFESLPNWNDGIFGENTKNAVMTFQEDNSLNTDGTVGKETLPKLINIYKEQNNKK
jgi:hypothetical protein